MGEILWREAPVDADLVIPCPTPATRRRAAWRARPACPRTTASSRTVTSPDLHPARPGARRHGLRLKFNPLPEVVAGKRLIVVDDSIVRGNTMPQIVQMLRDAGAAEVHLRISAPPIKHPCHYGIDMSTREEMIAHGRTVDEVARRARRRLAPLPVTGRACTRRSAATRGAHCDACFSGEYPLAGTEEPAASSRSELPLVSAR